MEAPLFIEDEVETREPCRKTHRGGGRKVEVWEKVLWHIHILEHLPITTGQDASCVAEGREEQPAGLGHLLEKMFGKWQCFKGRVAVRISWVLDEREDFAVKCINPVAQDAPPPLVPAEPKPLLAGLCTVLLALPLDVEAFSVAVLVLLDGT